jgi:N utilization substance protein A
VKEVRLDEESGTATVLVHDFQLSLAIGKEGQNARLAARLTGWRIDIKSESQLADEEAGGAGGWAEGEWVQSESGEMVFQPAGGGAAISMEEWERAGSEDGSFLVEEVIVTEEPEGAASEPAVEVDAEPSASASAGDEVDVEPSASAGDEVDAAPGTEESEESE